jgi:hypothetical protein
MKKMKSYLLVLALIISACSGNSSNLSKEEKARNLYQNAITIMTGSMFASMGSMMGEASSAVMPYVADTLEKVMNEKMKTFSNQMIGEMSKRMNQVLDSVKKAKPSVYSKLFTNQVMQDAVDKASKAELPKGFKPITENLNQEDLSRYVIYISLLYKVDKAKAASDPVLKMYEETFKCFTKLEETFKGDPDMEAFLKKK